MLSNCLHQFFFVHSNRCADTFDEMFGKIRMEEDRNWEREREGERAKKIEKLRLSTDRKGGGMKKRMRERDGKATNNCLQKEKSVFYSLYRKVHFFPSNLWVKNALALAIDESKDLNPVSHIDRHRLVCVLLLLLKKKSTWTKLHVPEIHFFVGRRCALSTFITHFTISENIL